MITKIQIITAIFIFIGEIIMTIHILLFPTFGISKVGVGLKDCHGFEDKEIYNF